MAVDMKKHIVGDEPHPDYKFQESPLWSPWLGNVAKPSAKTPKMKIPDGRLTDSDMDMFKNLLKDTDVQVDFDELLDDLLLKEYILKQKEIDRNNRMTEQLRRAIEMQNQDYPSIEQRQLDDKPNITIPSGY